MIKNDKILIKGNAIMYFTAVKKSKIIAVLCIVLTGIIATVTVGATGAYQVFFGYAVRSLPIYYVKTEEKKISISFDCAWGVDYTDKLLSIMEIENVKCTFFTVEFWTEKHPDYVKKIFDAGHEIGTHSATHPYMSKLNRDSIVKELNSSSEAITKITGKKVEVFRPPYGDYNDLLINTAKELGLYTIQWDVDSLDWKDISAKEIIERVLKRVKNGSIVLFHNQGLHTAEALPTIIKSLKSAGYEFVPIGELIYRDNYKMAADGAQVKNL